MDSVKVDGVSGGQHRGASGSGDLRIQLIAEHFVDDRARYDADLVKLESSRIVVVPLLRHRGRPGTQRFLGIHAPAKLARLLRRLL